MAGGLFPEDSLELEESSTGDSSGEEYDTGYKRSMEWDQETGDFVRDSTGRIAEADGYGAFAIWCYKMVQTERGSHMAYMETVESMLQRTYTEALMVNPRTESVSGFEFIWEGSTVYCKFQVKGTGWDETVQISV